MMRLLRLCCASIGLLFAGQAWADGCHLKTYGTLPVEMVDGQPTTMAKINGKDTRFILDTGAFFNTMSNPNALSLGLRPRPGPVEFRINGVGGSADAQVAHVNEFGILNATLKNIDFVVGGTEIGHGVLGANLLDAADLEIDMAHGKLALFSADHCDKTSLAYWSKDGNYNVADIEAATNTPDRRTFLTVTINGKEVKALLDSGASATALSIHAARRVGIDLKAPNVKASNMTIGFGAKLVKTWIAPIDSFSVGTETIQHSQMQILDGSFSGDNGTDMLLGIDFLLAHHMFIANSQKKIYFTYNGGRVFTYAEATGDQDKSDPGKAAGDKDAAPNTAADYALRGEAHLSRGEPKAATADLDEAIRMAPGQAAYYVARSNAHMEEKQPDAALADLDKAVSLDPKNLDTLLQRAELRFARKDRAGAAADVTAANALTPPTGSIQARTLATLYVALDQPAKAVPLLDDWIHLHSHDAMLGLALNERCWALGLSNQRLDDALSDCRKAIKRDGANSNYLDSLGMVQLRLGHYPESIQAYEQAIAQESQSPWTRYGLGLAKIRSGQTDAGKADVAAARVLDPGIEAHAVQFGLTAPTP